MGISELEPFVLQAMRGRTTLSETVEEVLRNAILTGVLKEGQELNQVQLAKQFQVSRVPVREALLRLEAEGLVVSLPYKRCVVASLGPEVLVDIFDIRMLVECRALELAAPRITEEQIAELERMIEEMDRAPDHAAWLRVNQAFHRTLYLAAGRQLLSSIIDQMNARSVRYLNQYSKSLVRHAEANREHRRILDAVRTRDIAAAKQHLEEHLRATLDGLLEAVRGANGTRGSGTGAAE